MEIARQDKLHLPLCMSHGIITNYINITELLHKWPTPCIPTGNKKGYQKSISFLPIEK